MPIRAAARPSTSTVRPKSLIAASAAATPDNRTFGPDRFTHATRATKLVLQPKSGGPTLDEALAAARRVLGGDVVSEETWFATTTRNPEDVNNPTDTDAIIFGLGQYARAKTSQTQLAANVELEAQALAKLSEPDRERYTELKELLLQPLDGRKHGDPVGALALQTLLLEGKLPGARDLDGGDTLLGRLHELTTQPLAEGVDRQSLVADVAQELAVPSAINQQNRNTCAPTTIGIQLAIDHPAEYVRLVSGLATPEGKVTTHGKDALQREEGVLTDDSNRSVSQRLLVPALMELGNGAADYDNATDKNVGDADTPHGFDGEDSVVVLESLYGRDFALTEISETGDGRAAGLEQIDAELARGHSVVVGMLYFQVISGVAFKAGHQVLVTGTFTREGVEYVRIINPWGREEERTREDFETYLRSVKYPVE